MDTSDWLKLVVGIVGLVAVWLFIHLCTWNGRRK